MKAFTCLAILLVITISSAEPFLTQEKVDEINSKQNKWRASLDTPFANLPRDEVLSKFNIQQYRPSLEDFDGVTRANFEEIGDLPDSFDARQQWPSCQPTILDQGHCIWGEWSISTTQCLQERMCIAAGGKTMVNLSSALVLDCKGGEGGCQEGYSVWGWDYLIKEGTVNDNCWPWTGREEKCGSICKNGEKWKVYQAMDLKHYDLEETAKKEIMTNGSITATIAVYEDFLGYKTGVYWNDDVDEPLGYSVVRLLGWGKEGDDKYFLGALSWGKQWGEDGYFKMVPWCCQIGGIMMAASAAPQSILVDKME